MGLVSQGCHVSPAVRWGTRWGWSLHWEQDYHDVTLYGSPHVQGVIIPGYRRCTLDGLRLGIADAQALSRLRPGPVTCMLDVHGMVILDGIELTPEEATAIRERGRSPLPGAGSPAEILDLLLPRVRLRVLTREELESRE